MSSLTPTKWTAYVLLALICGLALLVPVESTGSPVAVIKVPALPPKPLPPDEALTKARCEGKYQMLLAQIKVEDDLKRYEEFRDLGLKTRREYAGHKNLPRGHWVYVYPYWYIWREETAVAKNKRSWGPEQIIGEPDTPNAGDHSTAWASRNPDGQDVWLLVEYTEPVMPKSVEIYETYNPGAVVRVTAFKLDGTEVEVWKGKDPTEVGSQIGVSVIPVKTDFKTNRVKIYIESTKVPGYNEIDAVGLKDDKNKTQWARAIEASTTYAQQTDPPGQARIDQLEERIEELETDVREMKEMIKELKELLLKKP